MVRLTDMQNGTLSSTASRIRSTRSTKAWTLSKDDAEALFPVSYFRGARRETVMWLIETGKIEAVATGKGHAIKGSDVCFWALLGK